MAGLIQKLQNCVAQATCHLNQIAYFTIVLINITMMVKMFDGDVRVYEQ